MSKESYAHYYDETCIDPVFRSPGKESPVPSAKTNWRLIFITAIITFLGSFESAAIHMSEWPYMHQLDRDSTVKFFGVAMSAAKGAHAVFVLVFSAWSARRGTVRLPLITGRLIAVLACLLYLSIEFFPSNRRFILLICYILFDISGSSAAILRAYLTVISTPKDRSKAFATLSLSMVLSVITGPLIQMAFTTIPYPGIEITKNLRFNVYSAPIWIAGFTNFVSIGVILCGLKDQKIRDQKINSSGRKTTWLLKVQKIKSLDVNWRLIGIIWTAKCAKSMAVRAIATLLSIILMVEYGWSGLETIRVTSVLMGGAGVLSLFIIGNFLICKLGTIIPARFIYLATIVIFTSLFPITYPYPTSGIPISAFNTTDHTGCDPAKYTWCMTDFAPRPGVFLGAIVVVFGVTMPMASISLDTIYSKVLEKIDQNLMQGAAVILDDIFLIGTPTYATYIYTHFGLKYIWIINGSIMSLVVILWTWTISKFKFYS